MRAHIRASRRPYQQCCGTSTRPAVEQRGSVEGTHKKENKKEKVRQVQAVPLAFCLTTAAPFARGSGPEKKREWISRPPQHMLRCAWLLN
jgi:hypothetical protein